MSVGETRQIHSGGIELDTDPASFGFLKDSGDCRNDFEALRSRMDEDGYLYFRNFFPREDVRQVRLALCRRLSEEGLLDPAFPVESAIARQGIESSFRPDLVNQGPGRERLEKVIYGPKAMDFYDRLLGGPATHYDFTWLRVIAPGIGTYPHCDVVYMGRGTHNLCTAWVPLGDVPLSVGGLCLIEGSHRDEELRSSYCTLDVDTTCENKASQNQLNSAGYPGFGALGFDMSAVREKLGRRLLTAEKFEMGDLLTFNVFTVHGSLDNESPEIRMSSDSRYQLASEPIDERWVGEHPPGHGGNMIKGVIC